MHKCPQVTHLGNESLLSVPFCKSLQDVGAGCVLHICRRIGVQVELSSGPALLLRLVWAEHLQHLRSLTHVSSVTMPWSTFRLLASQPLIAVLGITPLTHRWGKKGDGSFAAQYPVHIAYTRHRQKQHWTVFIYGCQVSQLPE